METEFPYEDGGVDEDKISAEGVEEAEEFPADLDHDLVQVPSQGADSTHLEHTSDAVENVEDKLPVVADKGSVKGESDLEETGLSQGDEQGCGIEIAGH